MTPNLFLADLGPELELTPQIIRDACFSIRRNREKWLARRRTRELIDLLAFTAEQWLDPLNGYRSQALRDGPADTGLPAATFSRGLDTFFRSLTSEQLEGVITQDLGDVRKLDEFTSSPIESRQGRASMARGPELLGHICAGNLPVPALASLVLGILTKSAQFLKLPRRGGILPRLFAHSLAFNESKLGSCIEMATWPGGTRELEEALFQEVTCLTATGSDSALTDIQTRIPASVRFVRYGHRVSFGYIPVEALTAYVVKRTAREAVADITAWNQHGCLSPHCLYLEDNGVHSPESFAEILAEELKAKEAVEPRGPLAIEEANAISSRRELCAMRAAVIPGPRERKLDSVFLEAPQSLRLWRSAGTTDWTIVLDTDPSFNPSCLNRFIYLKPVKNLSTALHFADRVRGQVGAVALAQAGERHSELALELAQWGVTRICPLGRMQEPWLSWRHDGRPPLGDLVTWTDLES